MQVTTYEKAFAASQALFIFEASDGLRAPRSSPGARRVQYRADKT